MTASLIGMAVALIVSVIGMRYDRRTTEEKADSSRRALGYAVGVPKLFDRPGERP